jgi:hypothetical protein
MKIRYLLAIVGLAISVALPVLVQEKDSFDLASADFVRISPFRRSANVDGVDWLSPASGSLPLNPWGH